jgi:hypothetical protein
MRAPRAAGCPERRPSFLPSFLDVLGHAFAESLILSALGPEEKLALRATCNQARRAIDQSTRKLDVGAPSLPGAPPTRRVPGPRRFPARRFPALRRLSVHYLPGEEVPEEDMLCLTEGAFLDLGVLEIEGGVLGAAAAAALARAAPRLPALTALVIGPRTCVARASALVLAAAGWPPTLAALAVSPFALLPAELAALFARFRLRRVALATPLPGAGPTLATLALHPLVALDLCNCRLGTEGVREIVCGPREWARLLRLNLSNNGAEVGALGANAFRGMPRLSWLSLSHNPVGTSGARLLAGVPFRALALLKLRNAGLSTGSVAELLSGRPDGAAWPALVSSAASLSCQSKQKTANQPTIQPPTTTGMETAGRAGGRVERHLGAQ